MSHAEIDWEALASRIGAIDHRDGGHMEHGSPLLAKRAIVDLLGPLVIRSATDRALDLGPGTELARQVLRVLRPDEAYRTCVHIIENNAPGSARSRHAATLLRDVVSGDSLPSLGNILDNPDLFVQRMVALAIAELAELHLAPPTDILGALRRHRAHPNPDVSSLLTKIRVQLEAP